MQFKSVRCRLGRIILGQLMRDWAHCQDGENDSVGDVFNALLE